MSIPLAISCVVVTLLVISLIRDLWHAKLIREFAKLPIQVQASSYARCGATAKALELVEQLPQKTAPSDLDGAEYWEQLNCKVDILINAGCYEQALACAPWELLHNAMREGQRNATLTAINQAEALYNSGREAEALARLDDTDPYLNDSFARSGLNLLRAWILLHQGHFEAANAYLHMASDDELLERLYFPELEMTHAALLREMGQVEGALASADRALASAVRASSRRNALVMRASILVVLGEYDVAEKEFQMAFNSQYKAQAAYGLLHYGALIQAKSGTAQTPRLLTRESLPENLREHWQRWDPESALRLTIR